LISSGGYERKPSAKPFHTHHNEHHAIKMTVSMHPRDTIWPA
jgi:hypothetical protein